MNKRYYDEDYVEIEKKEEKKEIENKNYDLIIFNKDNK